MAHQQLIERKGPLLDKEGNLNQVGWSPQPLLDCNLEQVNFYRLKFLQPLRIKRWDYYGIFTPTHYFSFTISDVGYMGMIFCYVLNFETNEFEEDTIITPFGAGTTLSRNSTGGECFFENKKLRMRFEVKHHRRNLFCEWPGFGKGGLGAEVSLSCPAAHESMNIIIPIEGKRFYDNRKINNMPASGTITYQGEEVKLDPATCLGSLDWGRGVWALESHWVWASASGVMTDGRRLGLNLGYGFGDNSKATENAFIVDGKVHKLGDVKFEFDSSNYMLPWTMQSEDGRLDLRLEPFYDRAAVTDVKVLRSAVHQMFGKYYGHVTTEDGETIMVDGLIGFAEEHFAKW
ncbi:MAG: DUF2804 domain-containing protein [Anaerolineae bacterium]|jgi:hypothetical protein|nr:DUF2804 domain-containing protein [Anaerolineae bacterium]